ncbi:MAG TPA: septal ring lytic transglycosylase RlpA family protein, partial [Albitalea sp.]
PRIEPIRRGGPNKPYEVFGRDYVPLTDDRPFTERGIASWYGRKFHGRRTASGEIYNMYAMTAAHPTLPIPSYVRVRNPANQREVLVRVNDRGPFHKGRIIDLSYTAALKLGLLKGVGTVEVTRITSDEIRSGAWRKGATPEPEAAEQASAVAVRPPPAGESGEDALGVRVAARVPEDEVPVSPLARASRGFWVQLGAFRQRDGAESFHRRVADELDWIEPLLGVFTEPGGFRLQAGPYASREEAQGVAARVRESLALVPVVVEKK